VSAPLFPKIATLKTAAAFRAHLEAEGIPIQFDDVLEPPASSPLAEPIVVDGTRVGNRFCVLPMEGWDGTTDGRPSDLTTRRWRNFGTSGAKLIWGGEAVAVCREGRANPNQLVIEGSTASSLASLRQELVAAHKETFGSNADGDLFVGLQLTHSGRFSRPNVKSRPEPLAAYAHPCLDARFAAPVPVLSDSDLDRLAQRFVHAARIARDVGFAFVDIKHCHGYLLHELLSARVRPGKYGGALENRARFLRDVVQGIRAEVPGVAIAVRLSVFDSVPFRKGPDGRGEPEVPAAGYTHAFGVLQDDDVSGALDEARGLLTMIRDMGIRWICTTAGSPYYCPHLQRPAAFPPSDGYEPPEDPLHGVARQIEATAILKSEFPDLVFVGSGYTYLQEWLPHVASYTVRTGCTDFVGLGRVMLSYPGLAADVLAGRPLKRKSICRTFSDCTTGPRLGLVSGCYPLDPFYESHPDAATLRAFKGEARA
jgi:2,4-dienoyl-CoA reductase-like NADH-dependent reductase (Old Yellow Enzyme family)